MIEVIYWQGPGWYASRQEGTHQIPVIALT